ncbi:MAG: restriction endonuclease subunit S [Bacteroides sp.]
MGRVDTRGWREFRFSELFRIEKGKRLTKADMLEGRIRYIGASGMNNGITARIANQEHIYPANAITVSYNGSVGEAFYQEEPFWASDDVNVLYLKARPLTQEIALFLIPLIRGVGRRYQFTDKWKKEAMERSVIRLPADEMGRPDWGYMEGYIRQIISQQEYNIVLINKFTPPHYEIEIRSNVARWREFCVGDLFTVRNGKGITRQEIYTHPGGLPAIQSGEERAGCIGQIAADYCARMGYVVSRGACLTVARSGSSGYVGYQPQQCVVGDSAKILEPKFEANAQRLLFLRTLLMRNKPKYAYMDKVTKEKYEKDTIKLPVLDDGSPDWGYMEGYIEGLMQEFQDRFLPLFSV